tara:strand:- start:198 stop:314 length:117 start_codon:yes stop_codon:yes gene_type:complete
MNNKLIAAQVEDVAHEIQDIKKFKKKTQGKRNNKKKDQ